MGKQSKTRALVKQGRATLDLSELVPVGIHLGQARTLRRAMARACNVDQPEVAFDGGMVARIVPHDSTTGQRVWMLRVGLRQYRERNASDSTPIIRITPRPGKRHSGVSYGPGAL